MPELPEVETVRRSLLPYLPGARVQQVIVRHPKVVLTPLPLEGDRFSRLDRHGKLLMLGLESGRTLLVHLGLTGQLTYRDPQREDRPFQRHPTTGLQRSLQHEVDAHTHVSLELDGGGALHYRDIRKFGKLRLADSAQRLAQLARMGPDPLTDAWQWERFLGQVKKSHRPIKAVLLDQAVAAGVGNIYADEALFLAGIRPSSRAHRLSAARLKKLFEAVPQVLQQGIHYGGTTLSDYLDAEGNPGSNQEQLWAYGRYGQPCRRCGTTVEKSTVAQRTSSWCPRCQRA